ncbi:MAG: uridine kinase [Acholeplasmatales bacterium]|jgi:uridine kinase|nr:uridine kinase [Acholeplasmatales bacterium]
MKRPVIIAVAGGSASGKTTVVEEVISKLKKEFVVVIMHDDYYKEHNHLSLEERKMVNYDHPDSIDNELFLKHVNKLLKGEEINKPIYDFNTYSRLEKTEKITPKKVIILEGILVLTDKRIRELADIKLYVDLDSDMRFIRRMERDIKERGRTVESVVDQYLKTVKPMHHQFVEPTKRYADVIIPNDHKHDVAVDIIVSKINTILGEEE